MKKKLTIMFLAILACSLALMGCKDTAEEKTLAEAAQTKAELVKITVALANTESERDTLMAELATVTEARDKLQEQVSELTTLQNEAAAKAKETQTLIDKVMAQLQEQTEKAIGLQEQNKKLQETMDSLQQKLGGEVEIPQLPKL